MGMAMLTFAATEAAAEPRYDRMIAKAVADKVAERMGEMRGTIAVDEAPVFLPDFITTQSIKRQWPAVRMGLGVPLGVHDFRPRPIPDERLQVRVVYSGSSQTLF